MFVLPFLRLSVVAAGDDWMLEKYFEPGANELVGADVARILSTARRHLGRTLEDRHELYDGRKAAERIVKVLLDGANLKHRAGQIC